MALPYTLCKLQIHSNPDAYKARIVKFRTIGMEEVVARMLEHGSTVGKPDIVGVVEEFQVALKDLLLEGYHVNLWFGNFHLTVEGLFEGRNDEFDPHRHRVEVSISPGAGLRRTIRRGARLFKAQQPSRRPNPLQYTDLGSGEKDHALTPGGVGQVLGSHLNFDAGDPEQGVFFVGAARRAVRVEVVIQNKPSELLFTVPSLAAGSYRLEVRAIVYKSADVRIGELGAVLVVL